MKGFIEVTEKSDNVKHLINLNWIEEILDQTIYFAFYFNNSFEQDYIVCKESYGEIVVKIKEATR